MSHLPSDTRILTQVIIGVKGWAGGGTTANPKAIAAGVKLKAAAIPATLHLKSFMSYHPPKTGLLLRILT